MMIKRKELLQKYNISYNAFYALICKLPEPEKAILKSNQKRQILTHEQLLLIKKIFGDWNNNSFKSKQQLCSMYGITPPTFRKMLVEAFGKDHSIIKETTTSKYYSAKYVQMIEEAIGEP